MKLCLNSKNCASRRGTRGETITEALVSILIGGLALLMLATVIASAVNIVSGTRTSLEEYAQNGTSLALYDADSDSVSKSDGSISITSDGGLDAQLSRKSESSAVEYYMVEEGNRVVVTYRHKESGGE